MYIQSSIRKKTYLYEALKRAFDICFSSAVLLLGFPLFLLIGIGVLFSSKGPILHVQKRVGKKGRVFRFYKFRTMQQGSEKILGELLEKNPKMQQEWNTFCKLKNDPRITKFGKFLRATSLDEFPQFWNVLIGDLSIVGPRPMFASEIKKYAQKQARKILSVKPGLTGIWQVSGRSTLSMNERVLLELSYVDKRSFLLDLKLICKTVPLLFFSKGAY